MLARKIYDQANLRTKVIINFRLKTLPIIIVPQKFILIDRLKSITSTAPLTFIRVLSAWTVKRSPSKPDCLTDQFWSKSGKFQKSFFETMTEKRRYGTLRPIISSKVNHCTPCVSIWEKDFLLQVGLIFFCNNLRTTMKWTRSRTILTLT